MCYTVETTTQEIDYKCKKKPPILVLLACGFFSMFTVDLSHFGYVSRRDFVGHCWQGAVQK